MNQQVKYLVVMVVVLVVIVGSVFFLRSATGESDLEKHPAIVENIKENLDD